MFLTKPSRRIAAVLGIIGLAAGVGGAAFAAEPGSVTEVGGSLTRLAQRLAALGQGGAAILAAAPTVPSVLATALGRIFGAPGPRDLATHLALMAASLALLGGAVVVARRAAAGLRAACVADSFVSRGAIGFLALDGLDRLVVFATAFVAIELWFDTESPQDLLAVGLLWSVARWWLTMFIVEAALRPKYPAFRLIAMPDAAARELKTITGVVLYLGIGSISLMPLLLRVGMPVPAAQGLALVQGLIVAAGGGFGLWRYRGIRRAAARAVADVRLADVWLALLVIALAALWLSWTGGVLVLDFAIYHSLVWSLRIALIAIVVDLVLALSADKIEAVAEAAAGTAVKAEPGRRWIPLVRRSIRMGAIFAVAIVFSEVWLVDQLGLVAPEPWATIRRSLVTAGATLVVGYVAWRFVYDWTEAKLKAATPGLMPGEDDEQRTPASRLTTVLPLFRILLGIGIVVMAALVALSELGVSIGPLLAGAGIFGLAISFGSQALVRDIVSGIFFMADDAFRVGEYIDTGKLKGTVEKITLRSVQLRHQNGQIHTIPFGQLSSITNFSRDWTTLKFNLRLARDSDIEKVRKTVKQIGGEMMQDPDLGKELLQPLKLQGVVDIIDNAIVCRLKFTVRPQKPTWVQREALKRIYRVFGEKDIAFASNAVTVQSAGVAPDTAMAGAGASMATSSQPATMPTGS